MASASKVVLALNDYALWAEERRGSWCLRPWTTWKS